MNLSEKNTKNIDVESKEDSKIKESPDPIKEVVTRTLSNFEHSRTIVNENLPRGRAILTAFGYNHPGVVSAITKSLSDNNCDIQDMSQKIMQEYFTLIMLIDINNSSKDLKDIQEDMNKISSDLGIRIFIQHEDVFKYMHRI